MRDAGRRVQGRRGAVWRGSWVVETGKAYINMYLCFQHSGEPRPGM